MNSVQMGVVVLFVVGAVFVEAVLFVLAVHLGRPRSHRKSTG